MYECWKNANKSNASKLITTADVDIEEMIPNKDLMNWIDVEDRGTVIDFGCGVGRNTFYLADICNKVHGFDFPNMLTMLKDRPMYTEYSNIGLYDDWKVLSEKDYDTVFCCISLQHFCSKDVLFYTKEFTRKAKSLYVHGRDFNDYNNDKMFELLSTYWKVDKIFGNTTLEQLSVLPRHRHFYAKWVVK